MFDWADYLKLIYALFHIFESIVKSPDHFIMGDPLQNLTELHTAEQHTNMLHTSQRLVGVLARLCAICPDSNVRWPNVGPMSVLLSWYWANVNPTYIAVWLIRLWKGLPIWVTHTTEPAHHQAAGLCAAWWCAARLCVIQLGLWRLTRVYASSLFPPPHRCLHLLPLHQLLLLTLKPFVLNLAWTKRVQVCRNVLDDVSDLDPRSWLCMD